MNNPHRSRDLVQDGGMFIGRVSELNEIACFLEGNQSLSVVGPKDIGKSSLLLHFLSPQSRVKLGIGREKLLVYLDCSDLVSCTQQEIIGQFCSRIGAALKIQGFSPEPAVETAISNSTRITFENAVRKLNQQGLRIVLILDEFEALSSNPSLNVTFFNALRSVVGRFQFVLITASTLPLIELTYANRPQDILSSPFFNVFAPIFLGLLPESDARSLIQTRLGASGLAVSGQLEDLIYGLVGGHPFALNIACSHAIEACGDFPQIEQRTKEQLAVHFQHSWESLSLAERGVLSNLPLALERERSEATIRVALRGLIQKCLLVQANGFYRYPSKSWADFISAQPDVSAGSESGFIAQDQ